MKYRIINIINLGDTSSKILSECCRSKSYPCPIEDIPCPFDKECKEITLTDWEKLEVKDESSLS